MKSCRSAALGSLGCRHCCRHGLAEGSFLGLSLDLVALYEPRGEPRGHLFGWGFVLRPELKISGFMTQEENPEAIFCLAEGSFLVLK